MRELLKKIEQDYLITPKLLYFFLSLQFYVLHQFRANFILEKFGVGKAVLGYGLGFLMLITFASNIFLATMNDKFQRPRAFMIGLSLLSSLFFQLFYLEVVMSIFQGYFWVNLLCYLLVTTATLPLLDKIIIEKLAKMPNCGAEVYGRQRLWGSISYLVGNFIVEKIVTRKGEEKGADGKSKKSFDFTYLKMYQVFTTISAVVLIGLFVNTPTSPRPRHDLLRSWMNLLRNSAYMFFILIILLNGITRAAMTIYLSVYLTDIVKMSGYDLTGLPGILSWPISLFNENPVATTSLFAMIFEIIVLFNSKSIISVFGLYYPLFFAQVFQLLRFVCYYIMNPGAYHAFAFVCGFELLKGLNFGLTHISGVQIATMLCPSHLKTTSQMIYSGTFTGLASTLAGLVFGRIFSEEKMSTKSKDISESLGNFRKFFFYNIAINSFCLVLFFVRYGLVERKLHWPIWSKKNTLDLKKEIKITSKNRDDEDGTVTAGSVHDERKGLQRSIISAK